MHQVDSTKNEQYSLQLATNSLIQINAEMLHYETVIKKSDSKLSKIMLVKTAEKLLSQQLIENISGFSSSLSEILLTVRLCK